MDKARQEELIKLLTEKGAIEPCPRCKNPQFELVREALISLNPDMTRSWAGTLQVPVILLACKRCGYIAQHAERVLHPNAELK